ncbi:MAG: hypothetical protein PHG03_03075 [Bacilli bacterium]|nr:hypothetical protein [Bacilli bacterium]MDD4795524.1 hypothetical protein [Bacilli bacterium]
MKQLKIINKILKGVIFLAIFFLLVGITYSYFLADIKDAETGTTLTGESGKMDIYYDGGETITASDFGPSINPFATKTFTLKGTSNIEDSILGYKILLVVDENTFSENALSYTMISTKTDSNGEVAPSIETNQYLNTSDVELGTGYFTGQVADAIHTYELNLYFLDTGEDQREDMEKSIKVHINIENYIDPCPSGDCLNNHIISLADNPSETGVYNENGYRYQGLDPNNYVSFNNETWRIIGVFDDYTHGIAGENLVKIIRADSIGDYAWDSNEINDWNTSSLKAYLNSDYYNSLNPVSKSLIEEVTWKLGGYADYKTTTSSLAYNAERGTTVYGGTDTTWTGYIGLMYPSDYGYAVLNNTSCSRDTTTLYDYDNYGCYNQNWLYLGSDEWTITPLSSSSSNVWDVSYSGYVGDSYASDGFGGRPSLYLKSNTTIISGDGSLDNPYVLAG